MEAIPTVSVGSPQGPARGLKNLVSCASALKLSLPADTVLQVSRELFQLCS